MWRLKNNVIHKVPGWRCGCGIATWRRWWLQDEQGRGLPSSSIIWAWSWSCGVAGQLCGNDARRWADQTLSVQGVLLFSCKARHQSLSWSSMPSADCLASAGRVLMHHSFRGVLTDRQWRSQSHLLRERWWRWHCRRSLLCTTWVLRVPSKPGALRCGCVVTVSPGFPLVNRATLF